MVEQSMAAGTASVGLSPYICVDMFIVHQFVDASAAVMDGMVHNIYIHVFSNYDFTFKNVVVLLLLLICMLFFFH